MIKEKSITTTQVTLVIVDHNKEPGQYSTGVDFFIEKKENNEWKQLKWKKNSPGFTGAIIAPLEKAKTFELETDWKQYDGSLSKGEYRICKEIINYPQKKKIYAEFVIK